MNYKIIETDNGLFQLAYYNRHKMKWYWIGTYLKWRTAREAIKLYHEQDRQKKNK